MIPESDAGAQMSLNGNLEVFPLEEVLRLLARSRKTGCLRIESTGVQGRIFLNGGAMALATVAADVELRRRLIASGLIEEHDLRKVEVSGAPISGALAAGATPAALSDFVREESVEGLYRIRRSGRGSFDFLMELSPRYPTGQSFDAEVIVSESDRRALEWEDVESVLPSMESVLRMVPSLSGDDSVTLSPSTWQILAALGSGSSITQIGRTLGWSEFRSAREMAALFRNGLVTLVDPADSARMSDEETFGAPEPTSESDSPSGGDGDWSDQPVVEIPVLESPTAVEDPAPAEEQEAPAADTPFFEVSSAETSSPETSTFESAVFETTPAEVSIFDSPVVDAPEIDAPTSQAAEQAAVEEPAAGDTQDDASSSWWSDTAAAPNEEGAETDQESTTPDTPWSSSPWTAEVPTEETPAEATPWGGWTSTPAVADVSEVDEAPEATEVSETPEASDVSEVETLDDPIAGASSAAVDSTPAAETTPASDASTDAVDADRTGGWWAETMGAEEEDAAKPASENDADRFLESVFSSLSDEGDDKSAKAEEDDDETGFGMGLLRRRRMGAAARDISDNNNR